MEVQLGAGVLLRVDGRVDAPDDRRGFRAALELGDAPGAVRAPPVRLLDLVGFFPQLELELGLAVVLDVQK